ncbi:MAG: hypothetical protein AB2L20_02855 [Mangrovibacterium sp.]
MRQNGIIRRDALKKIGIASAFITFSSVLWKEVTGTSSTDEADYADRRKNNPIDDVTCQNYTCTSRCISIYSTNLDYWDKNGL